MSERLRRVCLAMAAIAIIVSAYPAWAGGGGGGGGGCAGRHDRYSDGSSYRGK
jgi:hypothetical protein